MKLYFATDIHGSERCFRKLLMAPDFYGADALILGGDLIGKFLAPVERRGSRWRGYFGARASELETAAEVQAFKDDARSSGAYPVDLGEGEAERLGEDQQFFSEVFERAIADSLARWMEMATDALRPLGVPLFVIPGNDDPWSIDPILEAAGDPVVCVEQRTAPLTDELHVFGYGITTPTPWDSPREHSEEQVAADLHKLLGSAAQAPLIWNVHCPPYDSGLDIAPKVKPDLSVESTMGAVLTGPVGSRAVRAAIEEFRPLVSLHGHVHESRAATKVGKTLCVNPGSEYPDGVLRGALVSLKKGKVRGHQLVAG